MKILIIGNGIAGVTAARHLRKLSDDVEITIISDETDYFFSRTALMYVFMGHMRPKDVQPYENWFWKKNRINLVRGRVTSIDFKEKNIFLNSIVWKVASDKSNDNKSMTNHSSLTTNHLSYNKLIIATGSKSNKFGWKGQDLDGVHGLYHWQDLEAMQRHAQTGIKRAVIVGGGLIGIEMAEMFLSHQIPVTFLVREKSFWDAVLPPEESEMINRHIREHHIDLRLQTELSEILDENNDGKADAVILKSGEKISCDFVGLTVGVSPNVDFLKSDNGQWTIDNGNDLSNAQELNIKKGIIVNEFLETNIPDVYAVGDCAEIEKPQPGRKSIEAVWYTGRMMGEKVAKNILGKKEIYKPGIWFNSAKFLDIEYQVYGEITSVLPENQEAIYWEHVYSKKSIRIQFEINSGIVRGFNLMGIRYRQEVCEKWIKESTHIEEVLKHLGMANFDPEFFSQYEQAVVDIYNKQTGKNITLKTKRGLKLVQDFLKVF